MLNKSVINSCVNLLDSIYNHFFLPDSEQTFIFSDHFVLSTFPTFIICNFIVLLLTSSGLKLKTLKVTSTT